MALTELLTLIGYQDAAAMVADFLAADLDELATIDDELSVALINGLRERGYTDAETDPRFARPSFPGVKHLISLFQRAADAQSAAIDDGTNVNDMSPANITLELAFVKDIGALYGALLAHRAGMSHSAPDGDKRFARRYVSGAAASAPIAKTVLPSGGVFGEAVLGQAVSAEKIDLTRFWNWKDSPIPILPPDMTPLSLASRAVGQTFSSTQMEASITDILTPLMPAGQDLGAAVGKIVSSFRDMSGQDSTQRILAAQIGAASAGAAKAGDLSVQTLKQNQEFGKALLDSDIVKSAFAQVLPEGEAATVLGGLIGATKGKAAAKGESAVKAAAKPAAGGAKHSGGAKPSGGGAAPAPAPAGH